MRLIRSLVQGVRFRRDLIAPIAALEKAGSDPRLPRLRKAMLRAARNQRTIAEEDAIRTIELRRGELLRATQTIQVLDYGAGQADRPHSAANTGRGTSVELTISQVCSASKSKPWAGLLFDLVREFTPVTMVEMGTCVGISGSYIAAAMRLNGIGHLYTLEGDPATAAIAQETFDDLGLAEMVDAVVGPFNTTLVETLQRHAPIEMVFVDGHHDGDATIAYFEQIKPHLAESAIVTFDDLTWSDGMQKAWRRISADPMITQAVDMHRMGLVVI